MTSPSRDERLAHHAAGLCRIAAYSTSALVTGAFLYHVLRGSTAYLGLLEDDYFYYSIIADKFVTLGKLSYDGTTLTNGFHPLWFAIVLGLRAVTGRFGGAFYTALAAISLASMALTYELSRRFARELGASTPLSCSIAAVYALANARLLMNGMETIIGVPLFLWLLIEVARTRSISPTRAAKLGFIASIAILARLDIAIAVALLLAGVVVLVRPPLGALLRALAAFGAGGVLVPIYAAANALFFGSPLPVSALAKRLLTAPGFSVRYARIVAMGTVYGPTIGVLLPAGLVALFLLVRSEPRLRPHSRFAGGLAIVFAFAFFGYNALTGWIMFGWYAYPIGPAATAAMVFVCERWGPLPASARVKTFAVAALVALAPVFGVRYFIEHGPRWSVGDNSMLAMSYELAEHMRGRQGLLAMGAVAGVATYVLDKPVFQLEGIVSDRALVEHVRREDALEDVLREYHVDYLVVSLAQVRQEQHDGCYEVTQPNAEWAGSRTAKMRGDICREPIAHFFTPQGTNPWSVFPTMETLVWDVRGARWKTR